MVYFGGLVLRWDFSEKRAGINNGRYTG